MKKVRTGIIGVGNMGSGHFKTILEGEVPDLEITAIADRRPERLAWAAEKYAQLVAEGKTPTLFASGSGMLGVIAVADEIREGSVEAIAALHNEGIHVCMVTGDRLATSEAVGARVAGTGNLSEATVGYCTKDGDTSCDFSMLGSVTSIEVVQIGLTMEELPRDLVVKTPTDGLSGMSDEEKLGLKYADIHAYIRMGTCGDPAIDEKIARKERANMHKRRMPLILDAFKGEDENP